MTVSSSQKRLLAQSGAVLTVAVLLLATFGVFKRGSTSTMSLTVREGTARIIRDSKTLLVEKSAPVQPGDRIIQGRPGIAELNLASGRSFELIDSETVVAGNTALELISGRALLEISEPARVEVGQITVSASKAVARIEKSLSVRVGVYSGDAVVKRGPSRLQLPWLRQAVIAGGIVPGVPLPLRIDASDRWDRRFLQVAIDLDIRLANFGRGLEAQLGSGAGLAFFIRALPDMGNISFVNSFLESRRSDLLIGLAVTAESLIAKRGDLGGRFRHIFGLWIDGGSWGLIAYEYGVGDGIFQRLLRAISNSGLILAGAGPGVLLAGPAVGLGPDLGGPAGSLTGGGSENGGPNGGGEGGPELPIEPPDSPVDIPDPVQEVIDELIGGLPEDPPLPELPTQDPVLPGLPAPPGLPGLP